MLKLAGRATAMKTFVKRAAIAVVGLAAFLLFCRGQGYEWTFSTDDAVRFSSETHSAHFGCFRRYDENTEYDRVLRCQADADKLIRDKFKWW
jgi:hypothetical protein